MHQPLDEMRGRVGVVLMGGGAGGGAVSKEQKCSVLEERAGGGGGCTAVDSSEEVNFTPEGTACCESPDWRVRAANNFRLPTVSWQTLAQA